MALDASLAVGPSTPGIRDMTIGELLREATEIAPDRLALIAGVPDVAARRQWTHSELLFEAERAARALLADPWSVETMIGA